MTEDLDLDPTRQPWHPRLRKGIKDAADFCSAELHRRQGPVAPEVIAEIVQSGVEKIIDAMPDLTFDVPVEFVMVLGVVLQELLGELVMVQAVRPSNN